MKTANWKAALAKIFTASLVAVAVAIAVPSKAEAQVSFWGAIRRAGVRGTPLSQAGVCCSRAGVRAGIRILWPGLQSLRVAAA